MKEILHSIEEALRQSASYLPLEVFSFWGGFIEEVIAPIPSPIIMATAGSAAFAQSKGMGTLVWLSALGAVGKTLGAWIIYFVADKLEDLFVGKFGRFFGVSHKEIEAVGQRFKGGWRDALILFLLRALPVVPSSPVSVVGGIIKIPLRVFLAATLAGNLVRNFIYIYIGYAGISTYESLLQGLDNSESLVQAGILLALIALVIWIYLKRRKTSKTP